MRYDEVSKNAKMKLGTGKRAEYYKGGDVLALDSNCHSLTERPLQKGFAYVL